MPNKLYSLKDFFNSSDKSIEKKVFIIRMQDHAQESEGDDFSKSDSDSSNTSTRKNQESLDESLLSDYDSKERFV